MHKIVEICYKCGEERLIDKDYKNDQKFICKNNKCDSQQYIYVKDNESIAVKEHGKLFCKKCRTENFYPCGDGDGIELVGTQWRCKDCGQTVWSYTEENNIEMLAFKARRTGKFVSFKVLTERSIKTCKIYYSIDIKKFNSLLDKYKSILINENEFATLKEANKYIKSNKNNIIGYCKECGNEIVLQDKIDGYNIYECSLCKYPSHINEIEK